MGTTLVPDFTLLNNKKNDNFLRISSENLNRKVYTKI